MHSNNQKLNCYDCKYRGGIPGDAHSCCKHPKTGVGTDDPLTIGLMSLFATKRRGAPIQADTGFNVKGNPVGVKNGWFNWPFNFDLVWLEECDGFAGKGA